MRDLDNFQKEVAEWAEKTFPLQTPQSKFKHLKEEIEELGEDLSNGEEMADCFILLLSMAEMAGINLGNEAKIKLEINKSRKWGEPDKFGVCSHI